MKIAVTEVRLRDTCRLVPSRYPPVAILDTVASPEDLPFLFELESWTNDRISSELGILHRIPPADWVVGRPMASVIMAAFCHPRPEGGRFNGPEIGTAHAEVIYHRTAELAEVGVLETRVQMRLYLADFAGPFHDVRAETPANRRWHSPKSYKAPQALARTLLTDGSNGILYRSVRRPGGECLSGFRPALVGHDRAGAHYEYRWEGSIRPVVRKLG